jgi:hypothetical protein
MHPASEIPMWGLLLLLAAFELVGIVAWLVLSDMVQRVRRWTHVVRVGGTAAQRIVHVATTRALWRVALGTLGIIGALALHHGVIALLLAVVAWYGVLDHLGASRAARQLPPFPSARINL